MPSKRVIAGAALGCLFVCGLFNSQGMAQTASRDPVSKLIHFQDPGQPETKPLGRSAAKHSSKVHPAAKKLASTKPASKESTSNGAAEVTVSESAIDGEVVRVASPDDANHVDLATKAQGILASGTPSADMTVMRAVSAVMMAAVDKSNSGTAVVSQTPNSSIGSMSWLLRVIAALSDRDWFAGLVPDRAQRLS